jgi:hypothetical protein
LPSGEFIPDHFHVTEVGRVDKDFIDCGGTRRIDSACVIQVWTANDVDHRLSASKLRKILGLGAVLGVSNMRVEIEYGEDVASLYKLSHVEVTPGGLLFVLAGKKTDCLAPDKCGVGGCC